MFFPSRYPIMCAVMNGASDLNLALAVEAAGAMPSLMIPVRNQERQIDLGPLDQAFGQYRERTGHCNLVLGVHHKDLFEPQFMQWLNTARPSHIELLGYSIDNSVYMNDRRWPVVMSRVRKFAKVLTRSTSAAYSPDWADAMCIKGRESAGFGGDTSVRDLAMQQLRYDPACHVIPYGGIGSAQQVKEYMDMGAVAVACGTIFAASQESSLTVEVKMKIVESSVDDLIRFPDTGQRALVLGDPDQSQAVPGDINRTQSLYRGITGDGRIGHIYMGESIRYVTSIRSVREIVEDLAHLL